MNLSQYVDQLRRDLANAAEAGGPEIIAAAERLALALDPSARMVLLDALSTAADEVTSALSGAVVELRLRGREPEFVVQGAAPPPPPTAPPPPAAFEPVADDGSTSRVSLRLPETLKARAEDAASGEGVSLNTWLIRVVTIALEPHQPTSTVTRSGKRLSGWARA